MADAPQEHGPTQHHQPDKAGSPDKLKGKNGKWYIVGGLAVIALLVFIFVRKSNQNAGGANPNQPTTSLDPATQAALQGALQAQQGNAFQGGVMGPQGPAGPAGPAGEKGATGATGPAGKTGPAGPQGPVGAAGGSGGWNGGTGSEDNDWGHPGGNGSHGGGQPHNPPPRRNPPPKHTKTFYTVKPGDNLSAIAAHFRLPNWQTLYNANRAVVGGNPNLIHPGQRLLIP